VCSFFVVAYVTEWCSCAGIVLGYSMVAMLCKYCLVCQFCSKVFYVTILALLHFIN